jgi:hypothetical protein
LSARSQSRARGVWPVGRVGGENVREDKIESQIDERRKRVNTDGKCGQDEIKKNLDAVTIKGSGLFESC